MHLALLSALPSKSVIRISEQQIFGKADSPMEHIRSDGAPVYQNFFFYLSYDVVPHIIFISACFIAPL